MNYCKVAFKVFTKHNRDFVALALKKEKLKTKLLNVRYLKKEGVKNYAKEDIEKLDKEIKKETERLNELIRGYINGK